MPEKLLAATLTGTIEARPYLDFAFKSLGTVHYPRKRRNPRCRAPTQFLRVMTYSVWLDPGGGYCHIWTIWLCAAVIGMVFKLFTL